MIRTSKTTGRRATICMDLLNLEENLINFHDDHAQLPYDAGKLTYEASPCQTTPHDAITELPLCRQQSTVVSTVDKVLPPWWSEEMGKMPDSFVAVADVRRQWSAGSDVGTRKSCAAGTAVVMAVNESDSVADLETLLDEKFDFEIHTPENSDSEEGPIKTLLDSPLTFHEKIHAARVQLKDHSERSGTKDIDALFAIIRPDLPLTRPGSGDSAFAEPSIEELLDINEPSAESAVMRPDVCNRSNSLLRRRPESFLSGSMADLVRKAQEQEKTLIEAAKETAKKYEAIRLSATVAATPVSGPMGGGGCDVSPTITVPRLTFDASPEATVHAARPRDKARPSTLPRPRHSLLPSQAAKFSTPPRLPAPTAPRSDAPLIKPVRIPVVPRGALALPTSSLVVSRAAATTVMARPVIPSGKSMLGGATKATAIRPVVVPAVESAVPRVTRRSLSSTRLPTTLSLPKPPSRPINPPTSTTGTLTRPPKPEPLRANHTITKPPSLPPVNPHPSTPTTTTPGQRSSAPPSRTPLRQPESDKKITFADHIIENGVLRRVSPLVVDQRYVLPPAMAESVARLSTPKKPSPPPADEPLRGLKSPSPPSKGPAVLAVKRRLSFVPNVRGLSATPDDSGILRSVEGGILSSGGAGSHQRLSMPQKALMESVSQKQTGGGGAGAVFSAKLIDLDDPSEPSSAVSCGSISSNCENVLIEL